MIYIVHVLRAPRRRWRLAGAERGSRGSQGCPHIRCERVRDSEHATCDPLRILERLNALAEIIERRVKAGWHVDTLATMGNIAICHDDLGHHEESLALRRKILATRRQRFSPEDPLILQDVANLGTSLVHTRQLTEARSLMRKYLPIARRVLGLDHEITFGLIENLAGAIFENALAPREDLVEVDEILTKQLKRLRQVLGAAHPATQRHENHLKKIQERLAHLE